MIPFVKYQKPESVEHTHINSGADLRRVLTSELCKISDPELEDLFYLGFAEQRLLQCHLQGRDPSGRGPILIVIDSSGYMFERLGTFSKEMVTHTPATYDCLSIVSSHGSCIRASTVVM